MADEDPAELQQRRVQVRVKVSRCLLVRKVIPLSRLGPALVGASQRHHHRFPVDPLLDRQLIPALRERPDPRLIDSGLKGILGRHSYPTKSTTTANSRASAVLCAF